MDGVKQYWRICEFECFSWRHKYIIASARLDPTTHSLEMRIYQKRHSFISTTTTTTSSYYHVTYISGGHRIQFFFVAGVSALARSQVQRRGPMNSATPTRMDPRLAPQRTTELVLLLLQPLAQLLVTLLLARLVLDAVDVNRIARKE